MTFEEILAHVIEVLQREGRISYRALQRRFDLDDAYLEDVKVELIEAKQLARDENGRILVWAEQAATTAPPTIAQEGPPGSLPGVQTPQEASAPVAPSVPEAERRQLTVLFCDLADSTRLSRQLDPENYREVVRAYQAACAAVIQRFDGHIAQYLGDGLLVYFGYPQAHEDDAQRAVHTGLGILAAMGTLTTRLVQDQGVRLAVRIGIHTGLVVVGEMGSGGRHEHLALGDTPNLAARLQGLAAPNTVVMSAATAHLVQGYFTCEDHGTQALKGMETPVHVYQVAGESAAQSRLDVAGATGLTPLVGRAAEVTLLRERWAQVKEGVGQVVLLSGEAGIGKSRVVQVLKEQVAAEPQAWLTPCQCLPYYQNTALYPIIDLLERVALRFDREESPQQKLSKLEGFLVQYGLPLPEAVPLFAALLSLSLPAAYAPLMLSPEQQKQRTLQALLRILLRIAAQQPVLFVMEDLHWVDPSTLELLSLLVDQGPTARILALWTFRPDFSPPWTGRSHLTQVTVHRLPRHQAAEVIRWVAHGKALPPEVVAQIVAKTDGVPLFVEELTKMVLDSGMLQERDDHYALTGPLPPLAIPTTLHDSLMARLDRLAAVKGLAQLGATLGREFSYTLLQAVSPWNAETLQQGLQQLVAAEFLYQQGLPPQARYLFKHALIQEAAYQSLLKRTRQRYHQHIAQVLEAQFAETAETQPELLAYHYTEAGLAAQAVAYWQRAGQQAAEHAAYAEAVAHFTKGLEILQTLPEIPARHHQELALRLAMGGPLMAVKGMSAPDVHHMYTRAQALCQHVADPPQRALALHGVWMFLLVTGALQKAQEIAEQLLHLAHEQHDPMLLLGAHRALMATFHARGEMMLAYTHAQQGRALYNLEQHHTLGLQYGYDPGVLCYGIGATALWMLGLPEQALTWGQEALALSQAVMHPPSHAVALHMVIVVHLCRGEAAAACRHAETMVTLATESGLTHYIAEGRTLWGRALAALGQREEGLCQFRQGLETLRSTEVIRRRPYFLTLLAEVYAEAGQVEEGLHALAEAHAVAVQTGERYYASETYRINGELVLTGGAARYAEAEAHFQQALDVARRQEAKSLELRAAMSLSRLWQQQGKRAEAYELLAPIYGWFTEGFDTADLQEAKALLEELG
jgi:predicted ATPase/class 3 adenylate cyclase